MNKKETAEDLMFELGEYYNGNDWLVVKKYILKYLYPDLRKKFSTRDKKTHKHTINEYENYLIDIYEKRFNIRLELHESKKI